MTGTSSQAALYRLFNHSARPERLQGSVVQAPLERTFIGERCEVRDEHGALMGDAETVGFNDRGAILSLIGSSSRLSRQCTIVPTGRPFELEVGVELLGSVIDASGKSRARLCDPWSVGGGDLVQAPRARRLSVERAAPDFDLRRPVGTRFVTGVRAIDALLPCGVGQRVGIFSPAGAGKTSLTASLVAHSQADVFVIGLVGERGREVAEFVSGRLPAHKASRTVVVYATSDRPPLERRDAASVATTIAEYFRDQGRHVLLVVDSMTRYARALREVALAAGEAPARRGYPPSVFEALPRLLERSGNTAHGAITAFYTVLLEDEEQVDPIGEEVRSILDGHIYLSRSLAGRGHFPAIDVLRSASRVAAQVAGPDQLLGASRFRDKLARLDELQLVADLGEYRPGENAKTDALFELKPAIHDFLQQSITEESSLDETMRRLNELT